MTPIVKQAKHRHIVHHWSVEDGMLYLTDPKNFNRCVAGVKICKFHQTIHARLYARELRNEGGVYCAGCGIKAEVLYVERDVRNASNPHYVVNLYARRSGGEALMTHDHVFPRSCGGTDYLENARVMCESCNQHKGSDMGEGMRLWLTRPELRDRLLMDPILMDYSADNRLTRVPMDKDGHPFFVHRSQQFDDIHQLLEKVRHDTAELAYDAPKPIRKLTKRRNVKIVDEVNVEIARQLRELRPLVYADMLHAAKQVVTERHVDNAGAVNAIASIAAVEDRTEENYGKIFA